MVLMLRVAVNMNNYDRKNSHDPRRLVGTNVSLLWGGIFRHAENIAMPLVERKHFKDFPVILKRMHHNYLEILRG